MILHREQIDAVSLFSSEPGYSEITLDGDSKSRLGALGILKSVAGTGFTGWYNVFETHMSFGFYCNGNNTGGLASAVVYIDLADGRVFAFKVSVLCFTNLPRIGSFEIISDVEIVRVSILTTHPDPAISFVFYFLHNL